MESTADDWAGFRPNRSKTARSTNGWTKEDWRKAAEHLHERAGEVIAEAHKGRRHKMHAHIAAAAAAAAHGATQEQPWTTADAPRGDRWPGPGHHHRGRGPWGFGGPPFPGPWFAGGGRPRPRRGDVRLAVLTLLAEQPMHGYQIISELGSRSGGVWRPSPGSVYPTLQQLQDEGLVTVAEEDGRRTFSLTDAGRAEVERASAGRRAPWEDMADEADDAAGGLKSLVGQLIAATIQVATAGTHDQVAQAEKVLTDARRAMYRLLAEDEPKADS
ncbi:MAG TPA: PadR family transcriptional regulator [Acidothermaceae bacterium]